MSEQYKPATPQFEALSRAEATHALVLASGHTFDDSILIIAALENSDVLLVREIAQSSISEPDHRTVNAADRTVDDVLRDYCVIFSGRTRYAGQLPRDDELLVAEIERLRVEKAVTSDRLAALAKLKDGWDSYGGRAPNPHVLQVARTMTGRTPAITPSADGSVLLEWHEDGLDIELWLDPEMKREVIFVSDSVAKMSGAT